MLAIAPKDNLVRTFPSRVAVVIEPSRGSAMVDSIFLRRSCWQDGEYCVASDRSSGLNVGGHRGASHPRVNKLRLFQQPAKGITQCVGSSPNRDRAPLSAEPSTPGSAVGDQFQNPLLFRRTVQAKVSAASTDRPLCLHCRHLAALPRTAALGKLRTSAEGA
jgi:hypothetical protein